MVELAAETLAEAEWSMPSDALLTRLRRLARLTQEQLADRSGLSARAISSLECGARRPRRFTVDRLAAGLRLPPRERQLLIDAATRSRWRAEATGGAPPRVPLLGREPERAALRAHLVGDGPPLLAYTGEPGVGKTRLLAAAATAAAEIGMPVLTAGCQRDGGRYAPIGDAVAAAIDNLPGPARAAAVRDHAGLGLLVPELAARLPGTPETGSGQRRRLVFDATARFLETLAGGDQATAAGGGRVALLLDDMQWAGSRAMELLTHLLRRAAPRLRVVATYRTGELSPAGRAAQSIADLARAGLLRLHQLLPLTAEQAACLAAAIAGPALDQAGLMALVAATGGLPLFVVELAQAAAARTVDGGPGPAAAARSAALAAVPRHLGMAVRQQVAMLPDPAPAMLRRLAAGAQAMHLERLVTDPAGAAAALDALEAAIRAGVVEETSAGFRFRYPLVREIMLDAMGPARRRSMANLGTPPPSTAPTLRDVE